LPRQHSNTSINGAAMIAVGDVANSGGPLERVKPKSGEMHADARLLAERIAGGGDFRACQNRSDTRQPAAARALWLVALVDAENADVSIISGIGFPPRLGGSARPDVGAAKFAVGSSDRNFDFPVQDRQRP